MDYDNIILNFTSIIYEALPFVVLGVVIAGILEEFVPQQLLGDIFKGAYADKEHSPVPGFLRPLVRLLRYRAVAIMLGGLLGLIFPMCECGIIAIMRRLVRKGVPLSVCFCYMLAGPIINVVVMLSTFVAFDYPRPEDYILGGPMNIVLLRVGMGFVIACLTSVVVEWLYRKRGDSLLDPSLIADKVKGKTGSENNDTDIGAKPIAKRLGSIAETSLHDFIDIMAFLVLGAALAAVGREAIDGTNTGDFRQLPPALSILIMMGIAVLFCLCSEADAFVAANFSMSLPPASKMAFMVLGPMFDLKLYVMWTRIFRQRLIWTVILVLILLVFSGSMALHYLWPDGGYSETFMKNVSSTTTSSP